MTVDWGRELFGQFDLQWNLAHGPSLETLTDEEYLWGARSRLLEHPPDGTRRPRRVRADVARS
jgi:hypothetical protein